MTSTSKRHRSKACRILTTAMCFPTSQLCQAFSSSSSSSSSYSRVSNPHSYSHSHLPFQKSSTGIFLLEDGLVGVTSTSLFSNRNQGRGLAKQTEGATPTEGGMTLYLKAGPDGESVGDCPFAHYIRIILHEKNLPYTPRPCLPDTKPSWLIDFYEGKMPALRHRSECYTESDVIAEYLEFFFSKDQMSLIPTLSEEKKGYQEGKELAGLIFAPIAKYLKSTEDDSEEDRQRKDALCEVLAQLEGRLTAEGRTGPYVCGTGEALTLVDCSLAPKLFHMKIGLQHFKSNVLDVSMEYPAVAAYMKMMFARESFQASLYPEETVIWGWSNARSS